MNRAQFEELFPNLVDKYHLFEKLVDLVYEKAKVVNITAIKEKDAIWEKHIIDSLQMTKFADLNGRSVMDLGTGGGFPGLVLAIAFPDAKFTLLDSTNKKIEVVKEFAAQLGLSNVTGKWGRAEELKNETYDVVVIRGVGFLPKILETAKPLLKVKGEVICYKTLNLEEIEAGDKVLEKLQLERTNVMEYTLPSMSEEKRVLISYLN